MQSSAGGLLGALSQYCGTSLTIANRLTPARTLAAADVTTAAVVIMAAVMTANIRAATTETTTLRVISAVTTGNPGITDAADRLPMVAGATITTTVTTPPLVITGDLLPRVLRMEAVGQAVTANARRRVDLLRRLMEADTATTNTADRRRLRLA